MIPSDRLYLNDILESINFIERNTKGVSKSEFLSNEVLFHAVVRNLEIIGEAVSCLSASAKRDSPSTPWRQIADFRNVLAHEYFGVRMDIIWEVIVQDLPPLKKAVEELTGQYS